MSESETGYVYTLTDPRTDEVRYVGATKDPQRRLKCHKSNPPNDDLGAWIDELDSDGYGPEMNVINVASVGELSQKEREALDRLSDRFDLLNGQDYSGYTKPSTFNNRQHGRLNDTDEAILREIVDNGRATTTLLAETVDVSRTYAGDRIRRLRELGYLTEVAPNLYKIPDDGRAKLEDSR